MGSTLLAYKAWEVEQGNALDAESSDMDGIPSHVASAYQKAMEMYNARVQYEEQISKQDISETEKLQNFMVNGSSLSFNKLVLGILLCFFLFPGALFCFVHSFFPFYLILLETFVCFLTLLIITVEQNAFLFKVTVCQKFHVSCVYLKY